MEFSYSQLKQKDVINLSDGKHLGKVCDVTVSFPENDFIGVTVTGCKGFKLTKQDLFIPVKCINKIGEDAVLVKLSDEKSPKPPKRTPQNCPPPCPPCPPCPPPCPPQPRRSLDEYE